MSSRDVSFVFDLDHYPGHEFDLFAWPLNLDRELKLSHLQDAIKEQVCSHEATYLWSMGFTSRKNHIFKPPKCRKWVRTMLGTLEREFQDSAVNVFSERQNARSELTRCVVRVWSYLWPWPRIWSFRMTFELWTWIKTITFSGRHKEENVFARSYVPLKHGFLD